MPDNPNSGPVPFGVRDDGSVLDGVSDEAPGLSPAWPLDKPVMQAKAAEREQHFGVDENEYDPNDLHDVGWAVLFAPGLDEKIKEALQPLLERRKVQVDDERLFKILDGDYHPPEKAEDWLTRHGARMATVVPLAGVPYYVLIVGSPDQIPFEFQYELDIFWAVGRLWFETADEFRQYAASVVKYETDAEVSRSRQIAFFATRNSNDRATELLMNQVALPMLNGTAVTKPLGRARKLNFALSPFLGENAEGTDLDNIFRGRIPNGPPALLFTGSHGRTGDIADPAFSDIRGALICNSWTKGRAISRDQFYAGADLPSDADVHGLIHFLFACYGAGWPEIDNFSRTAEKQTRIAPKPAIAQLPQKLLSHPNGGALAVIGHVDRAWAWSFQSADGTGQTGEFRMVLNSLMAGDRIGQAMDEFNKTWAALSTGIGETLHQIQSMGRQLPPEELNKLKNRWVARDDARNYVVLGDPAVQLRTDHMPSIILKEKD